jgi:hypothetical protein
LANQKAELVAQPRLAVRRAISIVVFISIRFDWWGLRWLGGAAKFLDGAQSDPVGLSQRTIYSSRLCDAHFSAMHKSRTVRRIGVAVANEPSRE